MLACAHVRGDVEWIQGDVCTTDLNDRYDLVVMTGHTFQVLVDDTVLRDSLAAIRSRLADRGRFVFETAQSRGARVEHAAARRQGLQSGFS